MKLSKRKPSGREKDAESLQELETLREQLYGSNLTAVRQCAFHLSWLQEDGLEILKEALYSRASRRTKGAASYGIRKMRGRMRGPAKQVLIEGTEHSSRDTAEICRNALRVLEDPKGAQRAHRNRKRRSSRIEIRDIPRRGNHSARNTRRVNRFSHR